MDKKLFEKIYQKHQQCIEEWEMLNKSRASEIFIETFPLVDLMVHKKIPFDSYIEYVRQVSSKAVNIADDEFLVHLQKVLTDRPSYNEYITSFRRYNAESLRLSPDEYNKLD